MIKMYNFLFSLKKIIAILLLPSSLIFLCLFFGFLFWPLKRQRRIARNCFFGALFIYITAATAPFPNFFLWWLEKPFKPVSITYLQHFHIDTLVVLMGGIKDVESSFAIDRLSSYSRIRIIKTWEIIRRDPQIKTVIIIGAKKSYSLISEADTGQKLLKSLGIPNYISIKVIYSPDTFQSLAALTSVIKGKKFSLITSAFHLRRSMYIAHIFHLHPIPIPCNYLHKACRWSISYIWPNPVCLEKSNLVTHEYLGLIELWFIHWLYKLF